MATRGEQAHTMDQLWEDVSARFHQRTGKSLDMKPARTLKDCIQEIEVTRQPTNDPEQNGTHNKTEKAKEYGRNILQCLKLLGGVVAEGAGMVFAPSSLCFNALSMLLDIPEQIHAFHGAVDGLFEVLWPSLSNFEIYGKIEQFDSIEPELRLAIHRLMASFVDICALSVELRQSGKWRKFKVGMKLVLLQNDSGVKEEIERFQALTVAHTSIQGTQSLKLLLESKSSIFNLLQKASDTGEQVEKLTGTMGKIKDAEDKRSAKETRQAQLASIKKKLDLVDNSPVNRSTKTGDTLWDSCVPGTARWFENQTEHPAYAKWADSSNADTSPILLVNGEQNTGKSVLLSAMARTLASTYKSPEKASTRTWVAAYYFPNSTGKEEDEKQPIEVAMKCIAYLLAEKDELYAKNLSQSLDAKPDLERYLKEATRKELWDLLEIGSSKNKSTHYVILDGIGGIPDNFQQARDEFFGILASAMALQTREQNSLGPRFAISVRPSTPVTSLGELSWKIDIGLHNTSDMQMFIDHELKAKDLFQDDDEDSVRMRTKIRNTLSREVKGNFSKVGAAIKQIGRVVAADGLESDVDKILKASNKDEKSMSEEVVRQLQEQLSADEIKELNELLIWVSFGYWYFNVQQLEAALFLRFRTRPMLKLAKKLGRKYSPLFKVYPDGDVNIVDGISDVITKPRTEQRQMDEAPKFAATITITQGDLSTVQSFLWSLTQKLNHDSLGFHQLADKGNVKGTIRLDRYDAHLAIVRSAMSLLAEPPNDRTQAMAPYLISFLPYHLQELEEATGLDALTNSEKIEIGDGIYNLFFSNPVEAHWNQCDRVDWFGEASEVTIFRRWLADPVATSQLNYYNREWLQKVERDPNPNQALLLRIMERMAWRWLRDTEWDAGETYKRLRAYLLMPPTPLARESGSGDDAKSEASSIETKKMSIEDVEKWCKQVLGETTEDALWFQRLGETFIWISRTEDGIKAFNKALELGGSETSCFNGLARCFAEDGKFSEACVHMEKKLAILEKEDQPERSKVVETYFQLAEWYGKLKQTEQVMEYADKALQRSPEDTGAQFQALRIYLDTERDTLAMQLLRQLLRAGDEPAQPSPTLQKVLVHMTTDTLRADRRDQRFLRCFELLQGDFAAFESFLGAIDGITGSQDVPAEAMVALQLYKGVGQYYFGHDAATMALTRDAARAVWRQCLDKSLELGLYTERYQAATLLGAHHFEHTRVPEESEHHRQIHVERIRVLADQDGPFELSAPRAYLASHHMLTNDPSAARAVLRSCMESAFNMLSDDIDDNDETAYYHLACALTHLGDDVNARLAFSLRQPWLGSVDIMGRLLEFEETSTKSLSEELLATLRINGPMYVSVESQLEQALQVLGELQSKMTPEEQSAHGASEDYARIRDALQQWSGKRFMVGGLACDGCNVDWGFDRAVYQCRYCYNKCFCDGCLAKVRAGPMTGGSVTVLACNGSHAWLPLPRLDRASFLRAFRGDVLMGATVAGDGSLVGGTEVPAAQWLASLKKEWGYTEKDNKATTSPPVEV